MLNVPLYNALVRMFGDVRIANEDVDGEYEVPEMTHKSMTSRYDYQQKKVYANVTYWGEVYHVDCPVCDDKTKRLYISHLWGKQVNRGRPLRRILFGKRLYHCKNENCNVSAHLAKLQINKKDTVPSGYSEDYQAAKFDPQVGRNAQLIMTADLPMGAIPLSSDEVPDFALSYLIGRQFSPSELVSRWNLYFVPKGATYKDGKDTKEFFEPRLLMPVINRNRLVLWQARSFKDKAKLKYINTPHVPKGNFIYNMDAAWHFRDVVLVEGVTDVWRVGDNAICPFGKTLSAKQVKIMKTLWGHCGRLLIVLDKDARGGVGENGKPKQDYAETMRKKLEKAEAFPRGVYLYTLPDNRDPAEYSEAEIRSTLNGEFDKLDRLEDAVRMRERYVEKQSVDENMPLFKGVKEEVDFE